MLEMKDNFEDNELDNSFREAFSRMDVGPSDEFFNKMESNILKMENSHFRKKLFFWKLLAVGFTLLICASIAFIFFNPTKVPVPKPPAGITGEQNGFKSLSKGNSSIHSVAIFNSTEKRLSGKNKSKIVAQAGASEKKMSDKISQPLLNRNTKIKQAETAPSSVRGSTALTSGNIAISKTERSKQQDERLAANRGAINERSKSNNSNSTETKNSPGIDHQKKGDTLNSLLSENDYSNLLTAPSTRPLITGGVQLADSNLGTDYTLVKLSSDSSHLSLQPHLQKSDTLPVPINSKVPLPNESPFSASIFFSPLYAGHFLKDNNHNDSLSVSDVNARESSKLGYSVGIKLWYNLNQNWSLQTGLAYSWSSTIIKPFSIYAQQGTSGLYYSCITSAGSVRFYSDDATQKVGHDIIVRDISVQKIDIISVPLLATYTHSSGKFIFYCSLGATLNFVVKAQTYLAYYDHGDYESKNFSSVEGVKKMFVGAAFDLGAKYMLSKKLYLNLEPTFNAAFTPINENAPVSKYPLYFGLKVGVGYNF